MKRKTNKLPTISSYENLANFWDKHDLTQYEHEFVEVSDLNVNIRGRTFLPITLEMYEKIEEIAKHKGITVELLIRQWVEEKLSEV